MKKFCLGYQNALRAHLRQGRRASLDSAAGLGAGALAVGMETLELARLHERTLVEDLLPGCPARKQPALIKQAGAFFAAAITPIEKNHPSSREATLRLKEFVEALSRRTVELAASNSELSSEIAQRKAAEAALKKSELHYSLLLKQSERLQEQLRQLSRQVISAQEEERKRISRELHDVIAQTLTGINLRLATLKKEAELSAKGLERNIALTQKLVEKSVRIVHQFARELRPALLDDLGLIPALHAFMNTFSARTGIHSHLTASAEVEAFDNARRTALYRVAQEALTNVERHARASRVDVTIKSDNEGVCLTIKDDGKSFRPEAGRSGHAGKRLGLLGMSERMEMVGGRFEIKSAPGEGTTITARIPAAKAAPAKS